MNNKIPTQDDIEHLRALENAKELLALSGYPEYKTFEDYLESEIKSLDNLSSVENNEQLHWAKGYISALRLVLSLPHQAKAALDRE